MNFYCPDKNTPFLLAQKMYEQEKDVKISSKMHVVSSFPLFSQQPNKELISPREIVCSPKKCKISFP